MTTLAADSKRDYLAVDGIEPALGDLPVIASDIVYEGAAVGDNASGYGRPLVDGDPFRGFAARRADNGSGSAGDIDIRTRRQGVVKIAVTGASAVTDVAKPVYATDDNAFTLTPSGSRIGFVTRWITSTTCHVFFQAEELRFPDTALIVDPGASGSIAVTRSGAVPIVSAAAEARTLPNATFVDQSMLVYLKTDGGDVTLTVTNGYNLVGDTTIEMVDAGDWAYFRAIAVGANLRWRQIGGSILGAGGRNIIADPGASGAIPVDEGDGACPLVSATGETRTLAAPSSHGQRLRLDFKTDGGDITLTVTNGYDVDGQTVIVLTTAGQFVDFVGIEDGGNKRWRVLGWSPSLNTQKTFQLPLNAWVLAATGAPLVLPFVDASATLPGIDLVDSEAICLRWNNHANPGEVAQTFVIPPDCDITFDMTFHALVGKTGATLGDATTLTITAFAAIAGDLHDADADFGGATNAVTGDATAKTVTELTVALAAANLKAPPAVVFITINPTDGTLGTDDFLVHATWMEYTPKRLMA